MLFLQNRETGSLALYSLESDHLKWEKEFTMDPDLDPSGNPDYEDLLKIVRDKGQAMITDWQPVARQENAPPLVQEACQEILQYYGGLMALDHEKFRDGDYNDQDYAWDVWMYHADKAMDAPEDSWSHFVKMLYAMEDVDGDGLPELFIGYLDQGNIPAIRRVFAFDGEKMESLWRESGMVLRDGTVVCTEDQGDRVSAVLQLRGSRPYDVKDPYFSVGYDSDERQGIVYHGDPYEPVSWQEIPVGQPAAREGLELRTMEEILQCYLDLGETGQAGYSYDPEGTNARFDPKLGKGVSSELYKAASSDPMHVYSIFYLNYDGDGDGTEELLVGCGVSPSRVTVLAAYSQENSGIRFTEGSSFQGRDIPGTLWGSQTDPWNYLCQYTTV